MSKFTNEILMQVEPRKTDLGDGVIVKRLLPYAKKRTVGPFIFLDHLESTEIKPGSSFDVRPHPHIGLSTLSYLYEGQVHHRDSLGSSQILMPKDVNWMTAGSGIAHSERTPETHRGKSYRMQLLQFWIALPIHKEDMAPQFSHHPASSIPMLEIDGHQITVIAGEAFGKKSPVDVFSKLFFVEVLLKPGKKLSFDPGPQETAFYVLEGSVSLSGKTYPKDTFLILNKSSVVEMEGQAKLILFGGEPLSEDRHIYWNFVSSSKEKIEKAKARWKAQEFPPIEGETEFIPLPKE